MNSSPQAQSAPDARLAGGMMNIVQQLQKNRLGGVRQLQGAPIGGEAQANPENFQALLNQVSPDAQEQNATRTPRTVQEEGGDEKGRQRDDGQGEEESGLRKGKKIQEAEREQQRPGMR